MDSFTLKSVCKIPLSFMRALLRILLAFSLSTIIGCDQGSKILSITTGGTGGVYYPLGGGLANILSEHLPGYQVTAEVTGGSIDNLRLVGAGQADLGFAMVDAAHDAVNGSGRFSEGALPIKTIAVLYPNRMHFVTEDDGTVRSPNDLIGKAISVGSPGSATELMALRILDALGIEEDVRKERLSAVESVNAMRDGKIDAFFFAAGLPTAAVTDLAATPGFKLQLVDHADVVEKMNDKFGKLYVKGNIPKGTYPGIERDTTNANVWNILFAREDMPDEQVKKILALMFDQIDKLALVHKEAAQISIENQNKSFSPVDFHPAALSFYESRGVRFASQ